MQPDHGRSQLLRWWHYRLPELLDGPRVRNRYRDARGRLRRCQPRRLHLPLHLPQPVCDPLHGVGADQLSREML